MAQIRKVVHFALEIWLPRFLLLFFFEGVRWGGGGGGGGAGVRGAPLFPTSTPSGKRDYKERPSLLMLCGSKALPGKRGKSKPQVFTKLGFPQRGQSHRPFKGATADNEA